MYLHLARHLSTSGPKLLFRLMFLVFLGAFGTAPGAKAANPACAPADLNILGQQSANALVEIEPDFDPAKLVLRFEPVTAELLALNVFDNFVLPPTPVLPTGFHGSLSSKQLGAGDITITAIHDRVGERQLPPAEDLIIEVLPFEFNGSRSCFTLETNLEDNDVDGVPDSGMVEQECGGTNGTDYGFSFQIAEGVEINGLLTAAPFEFDGAFELNLNQLVTARVVSEGRMSFTGEIRAETDTTLSGEPYSIGSFVLGSYTLKLGDLPNIGTLTATVIADVFVGACGNISAGTRAGVTSTAVGSLGVEIVDGITPRVIASTADTELRISPPELASDVSSDVTLYGGAVLRLEATLDVGGIIPVTGISTEMTTRGSARVVVDPAADPWWTVSGRPEVYVDMSPQILTTDLSQFSFEIVNPPEQTYFTANDEFPFDLPTVAANRSGGPRESGTALRWSRAFLSDEAYTTDDVRPTRDGGALLVGNTPQFGTLLRVNYLGDRIWQRRFEGAFVPDSVTELPNDDVLVVGKRSGALWLLRLDANGSEIWSRELSTGDGNVDNVSIASVAGDDVILGGLFVTTVDGPDRDPWAARIDANGAVVWAYRYGQPDLDEEMLGVASTSDEGLVLVGETDFTPTGPTLAGSNAYTLRLNSDGTVRWSNVWASSTIDRLLAATQAPDGSFVVVGRTGGTNLDAAPRGLVIRYDDDSLLSPSEPRWVRSFGGSYTTSDMAYDEIVAVVPSGEGFTLAGNGGLGSEQRTWLAAIAEKGNNPDMVWSSYHDGFDLDTLVTLHDLGDGMLVGGNSKSFANGPLTDALWLSRVPYEGFMGWNDASGANALYTPIIEDVPPSYPSFADNLNITGVEDTTALEQRIAIVFTTEESTELDVIPDGFPAAELVKDDLAIDDSDGDGTHDDVDNCTLVANADQRDSNDDGYGNACDPDLDNDGNVNFIDLSILSSLFLMTDEDADLNGDGNVNFLDVSIMTQRFFEPPGPSGIVP